MSPTQQAYQPDAPAPRVETPKTPVITNTRREVLRKLVQKSLHCSKHQRLPTQIYGPRSVFQAAQSVIDSTVYDNDIERLFSHHIAAHIHCPVTVHKMNIRKLRKGPEFTYGTIPLALNGSPTTQWTPKQWTTIKARSWDRYCVFRSTLPNPDWTKNFL